MIKDVIIEIKGTQGIDDETDTIEFSTDGKFGYKNGEYYISYEEGQLLGENERIKTQIFFKTDNSVVLNRSGALNSKMLIEKDKRNTCFYSTEAGDLVIGIYGERLEHNLTENGGEITLVYTIDSALSVISRNVVNILVREEQ